MSTTAANNTHQYTRGLSHTGARLVDRDSTTVSPDPEDSPGSSKETAIKLDTDAEEEFLGPTTAEKKGKMRTKDNGTSKISMVATSGRKRRRSTHDAEVEHVMQGVKVTGPKRGAKKLRYSSRHNVGETVRDPRSRNVDTSLAPAIRRHLPKQAAPLCSPPQAVPPKVEPDTSEESDQSIGEHDTSSEAEQSDREISPTSEDEAEATAEKVGDVAYSDDEYVTHPRSNRRNPYQSRIVKLEAEIETLKKAEKKKLKAAKQDGKEQLEAAQQICQEQLEVLQKAWEKEFKALKGSHKRKRTKLKSKKNEYKAEIGMLKSELQFCKDFFRRGAGIDSTDLGNTRERLESGAATSWATAFKLVHNPPVRRRRQAREGR